MNISFIALNARYTHSNLAIRYLRNIALNYGHQVQILEFTINQNIKDILLELYNSNSDIYAFSVYIWNAENIQKIEINAREKVLRVKKSLFFK